MRSILRKLIRTDVSATTIGTVTADARSRRFRRLGELEQVRCRKVQLAAYLPQASLRYFFAAVRLDGEARELASKLLFGLVGPGTGVERIGQAQHLKVSAPIVPAFDESGRRGHIKLVEVPQTPNHRLVADTEMAREGGDVLEGYHLRS